MWSRDSQRYRRSFDQYFDKADVDGLIGYRTDAENFLGLIKEDLCIALAVLRSDGCKPQGKKKPVYGYP